MLIYTSQLLTACNDNNTNIETGSFLDSAVSGLIYKTPTQSSITNSKGEFHYINGEIVEFYIGHMKLGEAIGDKNIYPENLDKESAINNNKGLAIAMILQTLDKNNNLNDGIDLSYIIKANTAGKKVVLDVSQVNAMQTLINELRGDQVRSLVPESDAKNHVDKTKQNITPPVITLKGTNPMSVIQGVAFTDPGANAFDDRDGIVAVTVEGAVDTNIVGDYTLIYRAKDSVNNQTSTSRTVTVILPDITPPVITLKGTSPISVIQGTTFTDPGASALDDRDSMVVVTIEGAVDTNIVGDYTLTYRAKDNANNQISISRTVTVVPTDTTPPVITLKGVNPMSVAQGATFTNPGASALDDRDGIVVVTVEGIVDTNTVGDYTLTYRAKDNANNQATAITRMVSVVDLEAPIITLHGDDVISMSRDASYIDAGATATDNVDTTIVVNIDNPVDTSIAGNYIITYTAKDNANNQAMPVTRTVVVDPKVSTIATQGMKSLISLQTENEDDIFTIVDFPTNGTIGLGAEQGILSYKADNDIGKDFFSYEITSKNGESLIETVFIDVIARKVMLDVNELHDFSSNLPLIIIETLTSIPADPKIKGLLTVIPTNSETGRSDLSESPEYADFMEIDLHGSSSLRHAKKNYGVDTETPKGEDNDISLLGMPKEHKWILHAPYADKSLMRNYLAYKKTRDMGGYTAVRSKYVEVLTRQSDGAYRYDGVYVFTEKIKRDKNRVNIKKLKSSKTEEPDITGGYIMRQDRDKGDWFFTTANKKSKIILEYPKTKNLNLQQKAYIEAYMNSFENALYSEDFNNNTHANYYGNFINIDSFAKHLLSREFFRDVDAWHLSEFYSKERSGTLSMSPVWDFNRGMGNVNYGYNGATTGWHYKGTTNYNNPTKGVSGMMNRLMSDSTFKDRVAKIWQDLRNDKWSDNNLILFINNTKTLLNEAQNRNFQRWPVLGVYIRPNRANVCSGGRYCDTWEKAVDEHLKAWLLERANWLDTTLSSAG